MTKDPRVDAYIENAADFARPILGHLRAVVHAACPDVEETIKWGFPHFMHKGVLVSMAAFKEHCTFSFWKGSLVFEEDAEREAMGQFGRLSSVHDLPSEDTLAVYLTKAVALNDAGIARAAAARAGTPRPLVVPAYFTAALGSDARASAAFDGFSLSQKRDYVEWVTEARTVATRERRLRTAIEWMAEGKRRNWKSRKT